jgi:hypothetical protein
MHPHYPALERDLKVLAAFEKTAAVAAPEFTNEVNERLAAASSEIFEDVVTKATSGRATSKMAAVADFLLGVRESHLATGVKTASSPDVVADTLTKLATALYLDDVLTESIAKSTGATKAASVSARLLGREYAVSLMRNLLS